MYTCIYIHTHIIHSASMHREKLARVTGSVAMRGKGEWQAFAAPLKLCQRVAGRGSVRCWLESWTYQTRIHEQKSHPEDK